MIFKVISLVIGIIIFLMGFLQFNKEKKGKDIRARKKYGMIAYLGFAVSIISIIMLMGDILSKINSFVICFVVLVVFSVAGHFFLENGTKKK